MATPWWLVQSPNLDWYGTDTSGGFAPRAGEYVDTTTGKYVYEKDGKYWYELPKPEKATSYDDWGMRSEERRVGKECRL